MSAPVPKKVGEMEHVIEPTPENGMRVPVRILADGELLAKMMRDRTILQATNVAAMPGIVGSCVVLPDGHEGYGFPVGGVAAMDAGDGMISPGGVGYDINCGVRLLRTGLSERAVRERLKDAVLDLFNTIPSGVGSKGALRLRAGDLDEVMVRGVDWAVGAGHATSADAESCEEAGQMAGAEPSRVSERARKRGTPQLGSLGSGNQCNRQMITDWTRKSFGRIFGVSEDDLELVYDVSHNIAKVEEHRVDGQRRRVVVHRKGATRAFPSGLEEVPSRYRDLGQPVLVPGSMGTASWVLLGRPGSMEATFGSTAHGAGRTMSRSRARRDYTEEQIRGELREAGVFVKSMTREGLVEEAPQAYKDVDRVVSVSHELGIATRVARLVPMGVVKG